MAQYYQVLSQTEKPVSEELREYYPSIIDNSSQSVQYVIRPNEQAFQESPILVASDQLMVVDAQPQQLIVDQSQVTFQNQQYILQDSNIEFREGQSQQQIYYMDDTSSQVENIQQSEQIPQTIVLNHQLPGAQVLGPISTNTAPKIVMSLQRQTQLNPLPQSVKQEHTMIPQRQVIAHPRMQNAVTQNRTVVAQKCGLNQNSPRVSIPIKGRRSISEGSTLHYANEPEKNMLQYKAIAETKPINANQIQTGSNSANTEDESTMSRQVNRTQKKKPNRTATPRSQNRGCAKNTKTVFNNAVSDSQPSLQPRNPTPRPPRPLNRSNVTQQATPPSRMTQPQPQLNMQTQQAVQTPQYVTQPQSQLNHQQPAALPPYVPSNQIKKIIESTPLTEEYTDSIRMLVLLSTGEQRLITFTLPKEQCTIQEILEQVGVQIESETKIECNETYINGINYIVTVTMPQHLPAREQAHDETMDSVEDASFQSSTSSVSRQPSPTLEPQKPPTPEPPKEQPKYVQGMLALCSHCGYLSEDFNKCLRCKRKLPEDVKAIAVGDQAITKKNESKTYLPQDKLKSTSPIGSKTNGAVKSNIGPRKKNKSKTLEQETIVTLSSDEDEDTNKHQNVTLKVIEPQLIPDIKKEPSIADIQKCDKESACDKNIPKDDSSQQLTTSINCRTVRIGSYRFVPTEDIIVNSCEVVIKVPLPNDPKEVRTITIEKSRIVKVLANFQKILPVIFYYVIPSCSSQIREHLNMSVGSEYYFDPLSSEEAYKRITLLPEHFGDDTKMIFKQIYGKPLNIMDELSAKEANNILLKTCPKEVTKAIGMTCFAEIKQLLIYPPGIGGLSINTEDYLCLAQDQFLNDVIIDFYLKYLVLNLPDDKKEKVHVFSTFFYKRLTTKPLKASRKVHPSEVDSSLTPAQKRHARVKNWTKNVNLFEKDFIIVPINESCHWFLAIICFPGMNGCFTFDGKSIKLETKQRKKKSNILANTTITQVKIEKSDLPCDEGEVSDKDEAEGDDSELESEEDDDTQPNNSPIKQPCILIFDSLPGASRSRVVATLRDYLTCEYKIKMKNEKIFNKDTIKCACPKVPQQTNFTDCGLYLLQYVESFFSDPIKNYRLPIHQLKNWFEEITVTKKREDISKLIKQLMVKYNKDPNVLPDIIFPTLNGKLLPRLDNEDEEDELEEEEEEDEEEEEMVVDVEENVVLLPYDPSEETVRASETGENEELTGCEENSIKPSRESISHISHFDEQTITIIKPDLSEVKKTTNRDTLSYLKAKRIIRHKNSECSETKKFKPENI